MPLVSLVHQNLQTFTGTNVDRNTAFTNSFAALGANMNQPGSKVPTKAIVVGFTEVINLGIVLRAVLKNLATKMLMHGDQNACINIAIGNTAVGVATDFIGIVYDTQMFTILGSGRVLRVNDQWICYPAPGIGQGDLLYPLLTNVTPDYRGVAFIYGTIDGQTYIFGFVHNVYNVGELSLLPNALPGISHSIRTTINRPEARIIIGGDFNVTPADRHGAVDLDVFAATENDEYQPTTAVNCYDYWLCGPGVWGPPTAFIWTHTRNMGTSDHATVVLQFVA